MNYVTTNIRIAEEDYLRLKEEAAKKRKSFASIVREKLQIERKPRSEIEVERFMRDLDRLAKKNAKYLKGFDSVKALREIRYGGKW